MAKVSKDDLARIQGELKSKSHEELHLVVPKDVAAKFRQVAKASKISTVTLFEEMVAAHASGMPDKFDSK